MNRTFKFRIWSKKFNGWANHCAVIDCQGKVGSHFVEVKEGGEILEHLIPFSTDDCTIQQYTGLNDRLGKEIFEGDLLRGYKFSEKSEGLLLVEWKCLPAADDMDWESYGFHFNPYWIEYEIEGNIFENAELIKQK